MEVTEEKLPNGWTQYTLLNDKEMSVKVLNYGGIIKEINVPDNKGKIENVVLDYQQDEDYQEDPNFFGALIGRVAGRIAGSTFTINEKNYALEANDGENHLHGGSGGFHTQLWETSTFQDSEHVGIVLTLQIPHLSDGYPGDVYVKVTYQLNNDNQLKVQYEAESTQDTVLTLTNHTYFNLSGNAKRTIHDHEVKMPSHQFLELDEDLIPTGHVRHVEGTPFDFRRPALLRTGLESIYDQNQIAKSGYDHYFLFSNDDKHTIEVKEHQSGRMMIIETDHPGMVMYTANNLTDDHQLAGRQSEKYLGVCFETQGSPASLHHEDFPSIVLAAGTAYSQQTVFTFQNENQ